MTRLVCKRLRSSNANRALVRLNKDIDNLLG